MSDSKPRDLTPEELASTQSPAFATQGTVPTLTPSRLSPVNTVSPVEHTEPTVPQSSSPTAPSDIGPAKAITSQESSAMSPIRLTESSNGSSVSLPVGAILTIELPENPTTGYLWAVDQAPPGVSVERGVFTTPASEHRRAGTPGVRVFDAYAPPGRHVISFELKRPWEAQPLERRRVTLIVETAP